MNIAERVNLAFAYCRSSFDDLTMAIGLALIGGRPIPKHPEVEFREWRESKFTLKLQNDADKAIYAMKEFEKTITHLNDRLKKANADTDAFKKLASDNMDLLAKALSEKRSAERYHEIELADRIRYQRHNARLKARIKNLLKPRKKVKKRKI